MSGFTRVMIEIITQKGLKVVYSSLMWSHHGSVVLWPRNLCASVSCVGIFCLFLFLVQNIDESSRYGEKPYIGGVTLAINRTFRRGTCHCTTLRKFSAKLGEHHVSILTQDHRFLRSGWSTLSLTKPLSTPSWPIKPQIVDE